MTLSLDRGQELLLLCKCEIIDAFGVHALMVTLSGHKYTMGISLKNQRFASKEQQQCFSRKVVALQLTHVNPIVL